ncbi:MAG: YfiR family protein [Pseudomonadales bacterium]|nr:YfiR family protein [Pseudomonadales bacterium]
MTRLAPTLNMNRIFQQSTVLLILVFALVCGTAAQAQTVSSTDGGPDAIAKFLLNFGRFIDWPASAFAAGTESFNVCLLGENHFGNKLESNLNGKKAGNRAFDVKHLAAGETSQAKTCQIVYISASEETRVGEITAALAGAPVLTVGETDQFPENGGMIGLAGERGDKIAIRMHRARIADAGMEVREQLLRAIQ